jgi:chromosome segregation ATPase
VARQEELSEMADLKSESESLANDLRRTQEEVSELLQRISTAESNLEQEKSKYRAVADELSKSKELVITYQRDASDHDEKMSSLLNRIDDFESREMKTLMEIENLKESLEVRRRELQVKNNELQVALRQVDVSKVWFTAIYTYVVIVVVFSVLICVRYIVFTF